MGLFRRGYNSHIRGQARRILFTFSGCETGDMHQLMEQGKCSNKSQNQNVTLTIEKGKPGTPTPLEVSHNKHDDEAETRQYPIRNVPRGRPADLTESEHSTDKTRVESIGKPSELGDVKMPKKPFTPSFPVCRNRKFASRSLNWRNKRNRTFKNYLEMTYGDERDWRSCKTNFAPEHPYKGFYPTSGSKTTVQVTFKQRIDMKAPTSRTRHYKEENLQQLPYSNCKQSVNTIAMHMNERRTLPHQRPRINGTFPKASRGRHFPISQQSTLYVNQRTNFTKLNAPDIWGRKEFSHDNSFGLLREKIALNSQRKNYNKVSHFEYACRRSEHRNRKNFQRIRNSSQCEMEKDATVQNAFRGRFFLFAHQPNKSGGISRTFHLTLK